VIPSHHADCERFLVASCLCVKDTFYIDPEALLDFVISIEQLRETNKEVAACHNSTDTSTDVDNYVHACASALLH